MSLLFKNDIGARLIIETNNTSIPPSGTLVMRVQKPSGVTVEIPITAGMVTYATGVITYVTVAGTIDEVGEYKVQIRGDYITGEDIGSDIDTFFVYERLVVTV